MTTEQDNTSLAMALRVGAAALIVLVILAMWPSFPAPASDAKNFVLALAVLVLGAVWAFASWRRAIPWHSPGPLFFLMLALTIVHLVAGLASNHPANSMHHVTYMAGLLVVAFVVTQVVTSAAHVRLLMAAACWAALLASIYGFCQGLGWDPFPWNDRSSDAYTGLPATYGNANFAAHVLGPVFVMAIYLSRGKWSLAYLPMAVAFLVHIYFTDARGVLVALAAGVVVFAAIILMRRVGVPPRRAATFVCIAFVLIALVGAGGLMVVHYGAGKNPLPLDGSLILRYNGYYGAARIIVDNPLFGVGVGNYVIENPVYWTSYEQEWFAEQNKLNEHVHNDFLETTVAGGLVAAALHLALFFGAIWSALVWAMSPDAGRRRLGTALAIWFAMFFVDGLFGFNSHVPVTALFLYVFAGAFSSLLARQAAPRPPWQYAALFRSAVLVVAVVACISGVNSTRTAWHYQRGVRATLEGDRARAEVHFAIGDEIAPWDWLFPWQRGLNLLNQNKYADAIPHFDETLRRNSTFIVANAARGQCYLRLVPQGKDSAQRLEIIEKAQADLGRALELSPPYPPGTNNMGLACLNEAVELRKSKGDEAAIRNAFERAEEYFRRTIEYAPNGKSALHIMRTKALIGMGDIEGANKVFVTVFKGAVDNGNFWAEYYAFAQHYNKQEAFRTAVIEATDPASADAKRAFAALRVVGALWRTEDSGTYVEAARQLVGVSALPEVIADKGRSVVWSAQILESLVEEAVMPAEEQALARYYLSRVFVAAQKHMEAMVLITKAHADLPTQEAAEASIYIAVHYASREQYEPALSLLEEAFNAGVSDVGSRILYAQILAKTNRISEALAQYEGILKSEDLAEGDRLRVQQEFEALRGRAQGVMR
jgi:O-antigen ligase/tetratricopeptide (TPR) repeat protein